jgi:hypothetical protein
LSGDGRRNCATTLVGVEVELGFDGFLGSVEKAEGISFGFWFGFKLPSYH